MRRPVLLAAIVGVVAVTALAVVLGAGLFDADEPSAPAGAGNAATGSARFPEGVFRYRLKQEDVLNVVPDIAPAYLADAIGTFTWTVRDGKMTLVQTDCKCSFSEVTGRYTVAGDRLTVTWPATATNGAEFCSGDCVETVRWSYDGAALHIDPLTRENYAVVFWGIGKPWRRIE